MTSPIRCTTEHSGQLERIVLDRPKANILDCEMIAAIRERIGELARLVNLEERLDDKVSTYSLGMRQRLGIAQAPEGRRIFARMSVLENLEMGAYTRSDSAIAEDMDGPLRPGSVVFVETPEGVTHRDYVTHAWTENPVKEVLVKMAATPALTRMAAGTPASR